MTAIKMPDILQDLSTNSDAAKLLYDYYTETRKGLPLFSGSRFNEIASASGGTAEPNRITASDLVAVLCLGVNLKGNAVVDILEHKQAIISRALEDISSDEPLWDDNQAGIEKKKSPANELWKILRKIDGIGPVKTSKLMARKRPHLIPIYDDWIDEALDLGGTKRYWTKYRDLMLSSPGGSAPLHAQLQELVSGLDIPQTVTPLRACDVILWYSTNPRQADERKRLGVKSDDHRG